MKITKHGQSCFLLETKEGFRVLIDPGKFVFSEKETLSDADFQNIDVLLITHVHPDHFDQENVKKIIEREKPEVFSTEEVVEALKENFGIEAKVLEAGVSIASEGVVITGVVSEHGPLPNGKPAPEVRGFLVDDGHTKFYTPGDTILLQDTKADVVCVPVSGQVTTTADEAVEQVLQFETKPKLVIPIHYDNPIFKNDPEGLVEKAIAAGLNAKILDNGEKIEI